MRTGETFCPGVLHAVPAKDGLLMRIRVPGGLIEAGQLRAVAEVAGRLADGTVEITSRANLQIRAIRPEDVGKIAGELAGAGLLPSATHERVRNIVASPLAGIDGAEIFDTRAMVLELDGRLQAEGVFAGLSPKFTFGLHGGVRRHSHDVEDLALESCGCGARMRLLIGGADTGRCVSMDRAVECLLEAARVCIGLAKAAGVAVRAKRIGLDEVVGGLRECLMPCVTRREAAVLVEVMPGVAAAGRDGYVNVAPTVPLGRLGWRQAEAVAGVAEQCGGELRLAPWRGMVLGMIPLADADEVVERLDALGLRCDGLDGFHGVAACAGMGGCDASMADVRDDAVALAGRLAGAEMAGGGWTVNLSGCEKQCARRHGASAELIAGETGYVLKMDGHVVEGCSAEFAIDAISALHGQRVRGGAR